MADESLFEKIFTPFYERVKNPFMGSFIISWLIVNWKIGYATIFLDNEAIKLLNIGLYNNIDTKLEYVDSLVTIQNSLLLPLLGAVIYVTVIQLISVAFSKEIEKRSQERLSNKVKIIEGSDAVSGESYVKLLRELEDEKRILPKYRKDVANAIEAKNEAQKKITELNNVIALTNKIVEQKNEEIKANEKEINRLKTAFIQNPKELLYKQILTYITNILFKYDLKNSLKIFLNKVQELKSIEIINTDSFGHKLYSDTSVFFIGSPSYQLLEANNSFIKNNYNDEWINVKNQFKEFENSNWITNISLTHEEEKNGGEYIFVKPISINDINFLRGFTIDLFADDYVSIAINNFNRLIIREYKFDFRKYNMLSYKISAQDIPLHFVNGINFIIFTIKNEAIPNRPQGQNPYGLIYKITIDMDPIGDVIPTDL